MQSACQRLLWKAIGTYKMQFLTPIECLEYFTFLPFYRKVLYLHLDLRKSGIAVKTGMITQEGKMQPGWKKQKFWYAFRRALVAVRQLPVHLTTATALPHCHRGNAQRALPGETGGYNGKRINRCEQKKNHC